MTITELKERMQDELDSIPDYRYEKPIAMQIMYMIEHRQIWLSQEDIDYLSTLEQPLHFLVEASQQEDGYSKFVKRVGYSVRSGLKKDVERFEK